MGTIDPLSRSEIAPTALVPALLYVGVPKLALHAGLLKSATDIDAPR
jgi:hypothetical protein